MEGMKSRIFIVEDHKLVRDSYIMFLNMTDDLVVCGAVRTAEEALEQLDTVKPDLLLVDLSLPGMSGIELIK
jgi:DNA-binding NarL/FixJ family response regulator